jgi:hypothetical protein
MTHLFLSENVIELTQTDNGVMIIEKGFPDEDQEIFISKERIAKTIQFLQSTLERLEAGK